MEGAIADVTMRLKSQDIIAGLAGLESRVISQRSVGMCCATYYNAPRDDPTSPAASASNLFSEWPDPLTEGGTPILVGRRPPCRSCFQLRLVAHSGGLTVPPHLQRKKINLTAVNKLQDTVPEIQDICQDHRCQRLDMSWHSLGH